MTAASSAAAVEMFGLLESLELEWLKLPLAAVRDVGPAAQTLAGLLKITSRETFVPVATIASRARLPTRTVQRHLAFLVDTGWIQSRGRERTRTGKPRRTNTIVLTPRALAESKTEYGVLPWWACLDAIPPWKRCAKWTGLAWGAKVLLSMVMARLMAMKAVVLAQFDDEDFQTGIERLGGDEKFRFSLCAIERETGLDRKTIVAAKQMLSALGIVDWNRAQRIDGGFDTDCLVPRVDKFAVCVKPVKPGFVSVEWLKDRPEMD